MAKGRWGTFGARAEFTFTAAGVDSGPLPQSVGINVPNLDSNLVPVLSLDWNEYVFELTGNGAGLQVLVYGTVDLPTMQGNATEWFQLPAPSSSDTAQWSNPMSPGNPTNALLYKGKLIGFRFVTQAQPGSPPVTGTNTIKVYTAG